LGNLLTMLQFAFVAFFSFFLNFDFKSLSLPKRKIPLHVYLLITMLFFLISVAANKAFEYQISQPVHMVFRSSSLLASLIIGYIFFSKSYQKGHILGVLCVTIGVIVMVFADYQKKFQACESCGESKVSEQARIENEERQFISWSIGVALLTISLLMAALLGHIQEWSYRKYGKDWREGVLYTHLISLPYFLFFWQDIAHHWKMCDESQLISLNDYTKSLGISHTVGDVAIPSLWLYMSINLLTQLVCILGVYMLTETAGTLTTTLTITIRKFVSLVLSILYFKNPFSSAHWTGSALVFLGGMVYIFGNNTQKHKQKTQ